MSTEVIVTSAACRADVFLQGLPVVAYLDEPSGPCLRTRDIEGWRVCQSGLPETGRPDGFKPTNYIWNARRYAVKAFAWWDAAERLTDGVLAWLDADTILQSQPPAGFFASLLGDADVAYLGRGDMHPETGCVVFRLPQALQLIRWCKDAYVTGDFLSLDDGWTDCHVLRAGLAANPKIRARDLTSHCYDGRWTSKVNAFALSPLAPYLTHLKGSAAKREAVPA